MYLKLIETDDLAENIAESAFDVYEVTEQNEICIEGNYFHSDIDCQLDSYLTIMESQLCEWLNQPHIKAQLSDNMNVSYTFDGKTQIASNFQFIESELQLEADE